MKDNDESISSSAIGTEDASEQADCESVPLIVGIMGGSGSGKTVFTEKLSQLLGAAAVSLSHDDYYKHLPEMTAEEALEYDFDDPNALDTSLLVEHLQTLRSGKSIYAPSYNFATHARTEDARIVEPAAIVLVEGLLLMCDPDLRRMLDFVIFIDADPDVRTLRRIERDCRERGANLERAIKMFLGTSKPAHDKLVEPFKNQADIVIPNALDERALRVVAGGLLSLANGPISSRL